MNIVILNQSPGWYGAKSGYYRQISDRLSRLDPGVEVIYPVDSWNHRLMGKMVSLFWRIPHRNQSLTWAEYRFVRYLRRHPAPLGFVTSFESHAFLFPRLKQLGQRVVSTIHFPPVRFKENLMQSLGHLEYGFLLYTRDLDWFRQGLGHERIQFIPHGVDCDFFRPSDFPNFRERHSILVVGQFDRDFTLIADVLQKLRSLKVSFDVHCVVASHAMQIPGVVRLREFSEVHFHSGISDEELCNRYQKATLLLLPFTASGANNAIVEALACGTPIVTNDIGGIRDYGGGALFPMAGDVEGLTQLVLEHFEDVEMSRRMGDQCREFALKHLGWDEVARLHQKGFEEMLAP